MIHTYSMEKQIKKCTMCNKQALYVDTDTQELLCRNCYCINEQIKREKKLLNGYF